MTINVVGTRFEITNEIGRVLNQDELIGAKLRMVDANGTAVTFRIDGVEHDPTDPSGEILLYKLMVQDAATGVWRNMCSPGPDGLARAFPLGGYQSAPWDGNPEVTQPFSVTCTGGAIGKCVRMGYKPWKTASDGSSLRDFHQACVRMVRADYCGDGAGWTRDGTLINVFDRLGIQMPDPEPSDFEAAWTPEGAICVRKTRIPELITIQKLLELCPDRLQGRTGKACSEDALLRDERVLLLNRS